MENDHSMKRIFFYLHYALAAFGVVSSARAQVTVPSSSVEPSAVSTIVDDVLGSQLPEHVFRIMLENDVLFKEDNEYTNGLRFDYAQAIDETSYWGVSLTQNIYTPYTNARYVLPGEHPYAGYLALGVAYITVGENFGTSTEFQLGVTGDPSFAREIQRIIHGIGGLFQWRGWSNQVPAEITFQLSGRQDYKLSALTVLTPGALQTDSILFAREELGTFSVRAGLGYTFRIGYNLPPYLSHLRNRAANYGVNSIAQPHYRPDESSYYFLASILGEYVAHDLSIDGGVIRRFESTASSQPWQADIQCGVAALHNGVSYFLGVSYQSKRFRTQFNDNLQGVISVGWVW